MPPFGQRLQAAAQPALDTFGQELDPALADKAAAYLFFLARHHTFVDGNKRTADASAAVFLLLNGAALVGSDDAVFACWTRPAVNWPMCAP